MKSYSTPSGVHLCRRSVSIRLLTPVSACVGARGLHGMCEIWRCYASSFLLSFCRFVLIGAERQALCVPRRRSDFERLPIIVALRAQRPDFQAKGFLCSQGECTLMDQSPPESSVCKIHSATMHTSRKPLCHTCIVVTLCPRPPHMALSQCTVFHWQNSRILT